MTAKTDRARRRGAAPRWHVYILAAASGALYTGITTDVARRRSEHVGSRRGARFFRFAGAGRLVYVEPHASRSGASRREAAIKRLTRQQKLTLIAQAPGNGAGDRCP